jgi:ABC-type uncharacterized transport system permease subunit
MRGWAIWAAMLLAILSSLGLSLFLPLLVQRCSSSDMNGHGLAVTVTSTPCTLMIMHVHVEDQDSGHGLVL